MIPDITLETEIREVKSSIEKEFNIRITKNVETIEDLAVEVFKTLKAKNPDQKQLPIIIPLDIRRDFYKIAKKQIAVAVSFLGNFPSKETENMFIDQVATVNAYRLEKELTLLLSTMMEAMVVSSEILAASADSPEDKAQFDEEIN